MEVVCLPSIPPFPPLQPVRRRRGLGALMTQPSLRFSRWSWICRRPTGAKDATEWNSCSSWRKQILLLCHPILLRSDTLFLLDFHTFSSNSASLFIYFINSFSLWLCYFVKFLSIYSVLYSFIIIFYLFFCFTFLSIYSVTYSFI